MKENQLKLMKKVEAWNYTSVEICLAIITNYDIDTVYNEYKHKQFNICTERDLEPSDCFFIANSTKEIYSKRRRTGNIARLDLSKLF